MQLFITLATLIGPWFLFAGALFQAALEFHESSEELLQLRSRMRDLAKQVALPKEISGWWWLLPPVKFYLEKQRDKIVRQKFREKASDQDVRMSRRYQSHAMAWGIVSLGAWLVAASALADWLYEKLAIWLIIVIIIFATYLSLVMVLNALGDSRGGIRYRHHRAPR